MATYTDAILSLIRRPGKHYTAEEIFLLLKKDHPKIVLATVYNNLKTLTDSGRVRKISTEGRSDRYDTTVRHDHLVCRKCGELSDVSLADLTQTLRSQTGIADLTYDLKISYLCPACRRAEETPDSLDGETPSSENK